MVCEKDNDDHEEDTGLFTVFIVVVYIDVIIGRDRGAQ